MQEILIFLMFVIIEVLFLVFEYDLIDSYAKKQVDINGHQEIKDFKKNYKFFITIGIIVFIINISLFGQPNGGSIMNYPDGTHKFMHSDIFNAILCGEFNMNQYLCETIQNLILGINYWIVLTFINIYISILYFYNEKTKGRDYKTKKLNVYFSRIMLSIGMICIFSFYCYKAASYLLLVKYY